MQIADHDDARERGALAMTIDIPGTPTHSKTGRFMLRRQLLRQPASVPPRQPQPLQPSTVPTARSNASRSAGGCLLPVQGRRLPHTVSPVRDRLRNQRQAVARARRPRKSPVITVCTLRDFSMQITASVDRTAPDRDRDVALAPPSPRRITPSDGHGLTARLAPARSGQVSDCSTTSRWRSARRHCRKLSPIPCNFSCCHAAAAAWRRPGVPRLGSCGCRPWINHLDHRTRARTPPADPIA